MLLKPAILINDPELIRLVLIKEFNKFPNRGLHYNEKIDPLSANLLQLSGNKWKKQRMKISPIFTSGKLKQMFSLLQQISNKLADCTDNLIINDNIVDIKELISRYFDKYIILIIFFDNNKLI